MGRAILKTLKESTLLTFFRICKNWGLKVNEDYKYNYIESKITFLKTESEVYLKDLFAYPSDPEFDELGSTEYTGAFIDEASQISQKAYNIVMSRIRFKLDEYNLIPKMLVCTNPTKNFIYGEFYKPHLENKLLNYRAFIPALVGDNPFISKYYTENLNKLDKNSKERLLFGNWEYDDDPSRLFDYEKIIDLFTTKVKHHLNDQKYLTVDVARYGQDRTVICLWYALEIQKIYSFKEQNLKDTRLILEKLMFENAIPRSNVIIDEDGLGGGLVDELTGVKGFVNNSKAIEGIIKKYNYANLKSQCYYKLADLVNSGLIQIECDIEAKKLIIEDLEQIKRKDPDKDGKLAITPKEEIKERIGRSPDYGDALMMRMYFEIKEKGVKGYISI